MKKLVYLVTVEILTEYLPRMSEVLPLTAPCLGFLILIVEGCGTYRNHCAVKGY
jgi:hypothetical protein